MFGIHFGPHTPSGSPLNPSLAARPPAGPVGALSPPADPLAPLPETFAPTAPQASPVATPAAPPLPTPPASIQRKRLSPWDKEHISATLAQISRGFASSNSFVGGLANAAGNVSDQTEAWKKAELGSTEVGGPDSSFQIHTDQYGNKTYTPITAVQNYVKDKSDRETRAKNAPKPSDSENWLGDTAYAVEHLPPAQRPAAWRLMLQHGHDLGYDVSQAPPEYSPTFNQVAISRTIGARAGATNEATAAYHAQLGKQADARLDLSRRSTEQRITASRDADARGNAREARLRSAPPSKGGSLPSGFILDNH